MDDTKYWNELTGTQGVSELLDLDIDRTDLVGSPAIGRKFLLLKSNDGEHQNTEVKKEEYMDKLIEVLKGLIAHADNSDFADQAVDVLDRLQKSENEEDVNGLLNDLEAAFGESDTITKEQFGEWATKAEALIVKDEDEDEEEEEVIEPDPVEKSEDEESDEEEAEEEEEDVMDNEIEKSLSEKIEKQAAELKLAKADLRKQQVEIESLRVEKQRKELVEKASNDLSHLGKASDEIGDLLMSLRLAGVPDKIFDGVYGLLKSNSEMIKQSGFFNEFGTSIEEDESDPHVKTMKSAKELVAKGDFPTVAQAYASIYKEDPSAFDAEE